jgi:hypothetical protein
MKQYNSESFYKTLCIRNPKIIENFIVNIDEFEKVQNYITLIDKDGFKYSCKPMSLLFGNYVTIKSCIEPERLTIYKFNKIQNNKYQYIEFKYIHRKQKINIICPIHGDFNQSIDHHLNGLGCKKCGDNAKSGKLSSLVKHQPDFKMYLYYLELENNDGIFYKIGLTKRNPTYRLKNFNNLKSKKILEVKHGTIKELYKLEQEFKDFFKEIGINYRPVELIGNGASECFKW